MNDPAPESTGQTFTIRVLPMKVTRRLTSWTQSVVIPESPEKLRSCEAK